jgi:hypothetical protein
MFVLGLKAEHFDPCWNAFDFMALCLSTDIPTLPQPCLRLISIYFFPNGRDHPIDVSESSIYTHAQELRELLPTECQKGNLTFEDVESAFLRLAIAYARRTARLQAYGNRMFRHVLAREVFGTTAFPEHLFDSANADLVHMHAWKDGPVFDLVDEQDCVESPGEGLLLRTQTTTAEVLAQPLSPEVLIWEDSTFQMCHFLLMKLFGLPNILEEGATVCLTGLKNAAWLNGAEGTLGELHVNGRYYVDLHFPQSIVDKAIALDRNGRPRVLIPRGNLIRWPGVSDRFSLRRIQANADRQPGAQVIIPCFCPRMLAFLCFMD